MNTASVTLHALDGAPLADDTVRRTVRAAAHAIAERNGVELIDIQLESDKLIATLATTRLAAIGFAAELRRVTTTWYRGKTGVEHLWGEPRSEPDDDPFGLFDDTPPADEQ